MNYMKQVAKLLGVELNEEFYLEENGVKRPYLYKLTMDGMPYYNEKHEMWDGTGLVTLARVIKGELSIVKQPWMPKENEGYWFCSCYPTRVYVTTFFPDNENDLLRLKIRNCFKTKKEAEANLEAYEKWLESESITDWRDK